MEILKSIGISSAIKGFLIFLVYGFITIAIISIFYGLESDLPVAAIATIEGPISLYTFGWLSFIGLLALSWATSLGKRQCYFELNKPRRVFYFALPICQAAIELGVVIGGSILGIALCLHILFLISLLKDPIYISFYGLFASTLVTVYPVIYFTISLIDEKKTTFFWLNVTALIYIIFICFLFKYNNFLIEKTTTVGVNLSIFIILWFFFNAYELLIKISDKNRT